MYIISKHKDYYDSIGDQYGIDKKIVYKRDERVIRREEKETKTFFSKIDEAYSKEYRRYNVFEFPYDKDKEVQIEWFLFVFCGKGYVGCEVNSKVKGTFGKNQITFYYGEELKSILKPLSEDKAKTKYKRKQQNDYKKTLDNIEAIEKINWDNIIHEYKVPYFCLELARGETRHNFLGLSSNGHRNVILNPILEHYEFYRVKEPPTAFQEVQQFISGVIGNTEVDVVETGEKYRIEAAGFDYKTSFRKDPGKPKPRKGGKK